MSESNEIRAAIAANAAFYAAFVEGDYEAMDALWATTAPALCVHPGAPAIHGRPLVMESWRAVLSDPPQISASGVQVTMIRGVAFVTCLEHIGPGVLMATNVFVWEDGAWRIVHHQAGPVQLADEDAPPDGPLH